MLYPCQNRCLRHYSPALVFFLCMLLVPRVMTAQITIGSGDMPSVSDTIRLSTALGTGGIDPALTGTDYTWDFSTLGMATQTVDTFVSVTSAPAVFQLIFNNPLDPGKANLARKTAGLDFIPGLAIGEVYEFWRNTTDQFGFQGFAGELSGIPVPVKYDQADLWYSFPMNYADRDSSNATFSLSVPGVGYIYSNRKRWNDVDGWGELTTPFGTFQVLRMRSEVQEFDSIYLDSLGQGIGITRNFVEYKWMGTGHKLPLLQLTVEGPVTTVTYVDTYRPAGLPEFMGNPAGKLTIFPNPASGMPFISFHGKDSGVGVLTVRDVSGREIIRRDIPIMQGENMLRLPGQDDLLDGGVYKVSIRSPKQQWTGSLIRH